MSHSTIRTFRAPSVREALAQVRAAFGPDAVVLQAREVPGTLFRKAEFEVMAALDDAQVAAAEKKTPRQETSLRDTSPAAQTQPRENSSGYDTRVAAFHPPRAAEPAPRFAPANGPMASEPAFTSGPGFSTAEPRNMEHRHAPAPAQPPARAGGFSEWQDEVRDLRAALDEARAMLSKFSAQGRAGAETMLAPAASEAHAKLLSYGIDPQIAAQLIRSALTSRTSSPPTARPGCAAAATRWPSSGRPAWARRPRSRRSPPAR